MNVQKALVCASGLVYQNGSHCIRLAIPAWNQEEFLVPATWIPSLVLSSAGRFPDNKLRFYAKVNLDATNPNDLGMKDFESLNLASVFRK